MPVLRGKQLRQSLEDAVAQGGGIVRWVSTERPYRFELVDGGTTTSIRAYLWNISHGGVNRSPDEYRIQVTGISRFEIESVSETIILGWSDEFGVFAAFDVGAHPGSIGRSSSIQVSRKALLDAKQNGWSVHYKPTNDETVLVFVPKHLTIYMSIVREVKIMRGGEPEANTLEHVLKSRDFESDSVIDNGAPVARGEAVVTMRRRLRDASFRERILDAYGHRCACCGLQLELVQGAHVVPVAHNSSDDRTQNGVALCALHHLAFDSGLIQVGDDYSILLDTERIETLRKRGRVGGLETFSSSLRKTLLLPEDKRDWPSAENLSFRGLPK